MALCFFIIFGCFVRAVLTSGAESCSTEVTQNNSTIIRCDFQLLASIPSTFDFIVIYRCFKNKEYEILKFKTSACKTCEFDASSYDIPESGFTKKKINRTYIELEFKTQIDGIVFWGTSPSISMVKHKNCLNLTGEVQSASATTTEPPSSVHLDGEVQSASSTTTEPPNSVHLDGDQNIKIALAIALGIALIALIALVIWLARHKIDSKCRRSIEWIFKSCRRLVQKASQAPGIVNASANDSELSLSTRPRGTCDETFVLLETNNVDAAGSVSAEGDVVSADGDVVSANGDVSADGAAASTDGSAISADGTEPADQLKVCPECSKTVLDIKIPTSFLMSAGVPIQVTAEALPNFESRVSIKEDVLYLPEDQRKQRGNGRKYIASRSE